MMTNQHQITVSSEFFAHAFRDYAEPHTAWVREIFQNSADAPGCKNIKFVLSGDEDNVTITVFNDGQAMSEDTLVNKLLCLGGSQKEVGAVGGFGKAKELLYLAQHSYIIETGNLIVQGQGGSYELDTCHDAVQGTRSTVHTKFKRGQIENAIYSLVTLSDWKGTVTLETPEDGVITTIHSRLHKGYRRQQWGWGTIYTNKQDSYRLVVRMKGIPMFTQYCAYAKGTVVVELHGDSVDVLTSNRDGLLAGPNKDLQELVSKIAVDKRSAFRWRSWVRTTFGSGMIQNTATQRAQEATRQTCQTIFKEVHEDMQPILATQGPISGTISLGASPAPKEVRGTLPLPAEEGQTQTETVIRHGEGHTIQLDHEFVIKNGIRDTQGYQRKVPAKFQPCGSFNDYSKRLTKIWVSLLTTLYKLDDRSGQFRVGFIFADDCEAEFEIYEGKTTYYINPCKVVAKPSRVNWNQRWKTSQDQHDLIATACHEYAHLASGNHDEDYALELTRVMGLAFKNITELRGCFK